MPCTRLQMVSPNNVSNMCPTAAKTSLSEVLQSDAVKRLFNQPNLVIKTVPLNTQASRQSSVNNTYPDKANNIATYFKNHKDIKVSIVSVELEKDGNKKIPNLLPSKREGKSEISVVPIKRDRRECGHYETCENIVCDVAIQTYADEDGETPLLAVDIDDDEIDAPVTRHCNNKSCDALSIDHSRCRRALIRLHRCDKSPICDICGNTLKTRKSRVRHKKCMQKDEYRHNDKPGPEILKDRMRERELEMMQASKLKRNDYMDPVSGYNHAIETLKKNHELIIITKTVSHQQPIVDATSTSMPNHSSLQRDAFFRSLPSVPIMPPEQDAVILARRMPQDENNAAASKQGTLQDVLNSNFITTPIQHFASNNQYVRLPGVTQNNIQPMALNNIIVPQSHIITTTAAQSKPFLTPIRVVPITNLITPPSLLHQTQGIPRFCIMADHNAPPISVPTSHSINASNFSENDDSKLLQMQNSMMAMKQSPKKKEKKKDFVCKYCSKRFSIDWYFRTHVAMHKEETLLPCRLCKQTFNNRYDMKKHLMSEHKNENIPCDVCDDQLTSYSLYEKHMKTHSSTKSYKCSHCDTICSSASTLKFHRHSHHGLVECRKCCEEMAEGELVGHMAKEHKLDKAVKKSTAAYKKARQKDLKLLKSSNGIQAKDRNKDEDSKSEKEEEQSPISEKDNSLAKGSLIPSSTIKDSEKSGTMSEENL